MVHAPESASEEQIHKVVGSRRRWIYEKIRHPQKYQDLPHPPGKEMVNGESALYLGRSYRIEIVPEGLYQVQSEQRFLIPASHAARGKNVLRHWYIKKAKEKILPRVKQRARDLGVESAKARIVDHRYRWGSCTVKGNVNFNWRLIKAPMFVVDYVRHRA